MEQSGSSQSSHMWLMGTTPKDSQTWNEVQGIFTPYHADIPGFKSIKDKPIQDFNLVLKIKFYLYSTGLVVV